VKSALRVVSIQNIEGTTLARKTVKKNWNQALVMPN
jgi:hypothetical protein